MRDFTGLKLVAALAAALTLAGCAEKTPSPGTAGGGYKVGKPYQIAGVWYYPHVDYAYNETGIASWYGPGFHGKRTASGEVYNQNDLTAAHRTLPLPSLVRVTNLQNGRQIQLVVNDRGPFAHGRIIDVSKRAAQLLDFERAGTARVRVEILADESRQMAYAAGAYKLPPATSAPASSGASQGSSPQVTAAPAGQVAQETLPPLPGTQAAPAAAPTSTSKAAAAAPKTAPIEDQVLMAKPEPDGKVTKVPVRATNMFVQAGAFTNQTNANRLVAKLSKLGPARIVPIVVDNQKFYRVRVGPIASLEDADRILDQVIASGNEQARIVVE